MEIDSIVEKVIHEVLDEYKQPFKEEFIVFIKHILEDSYSDEEIIDRIRAVQINRSE
jgi:hypothetical protein